MIGLFKWKDDFSCNVRTIDEQHQKLFEIGSELYDFLSTKGEVDYYDEIMNLLQEMKDYTIYHFKTEEKLMEQYGYEELEVHKEQHKAFINKINEFLDKDIDKEQEKVIMDMVMFIADWIEKHILKTDLRYREFFNNKDIY
jgi:hemerythrin